MHQLNNPAVSQFDAVDYLQRRIQEERQRAQMAASPADAALHLELARAFGDRLNLVLDAVRPADILEA